MKNKTTIENLYKKSATETSPKDLDSLILAQAKADCNKKFNKSRIVKRSWLYGFSTAAAFVMGLTMIINLQTVNDQAMLPIELENSINQNKPQKSTAIKKAVTENSNQAKQTPDDSKAYDAKPILESPIPQAVSLSTEALEFSALKEETMQEVDDSVIGNSANLIQPVTEKLKKSTVTRSRISVPEKESANVIGTDLPEQDPIVSDKSRIS